MRVLRGAKRQRSAPALGVAVATGFWRAFGVPHVDVWKRGYVWISFEYVWISGQSGRVWTYLF
eukprot:704931-Prymnesium_polylepis.1